MSTYYLGYCKQSPRDGKTGRIRPLVRLERVESGWIYQPGDLKTFGSSKMLDVLWPVSQPHQVPLEGQYVRFRCQPPIDPRTNIHNYKIDFHNGQGQIDTDSIFPIVPETQVLEWRNDTVHLATSGQSVPWREGTQVYLRLRQENVLVGPFKAKGSAAAGWTIHPDLNVTDRLKAAARYAIGKLRPGTHFHDHQQELLLAPPPPEACIGILDPEPPGQQAAWLVKRLAEAAPEALGQLGQRMPGWRAKFADDLKTVGDPLLRQLYLDRWRNWETVLGYLENEPQLLAQVVEAPRFKAAWEAALDLALDQAKKDRAEEIQEKARQETGDLRKQVQAEREEYQREHKRLQREIARLDTELAERRKHLAKDTAELQAAAQHLDEARQRLIHDFTAHQALLERVGLASSPVVPAAPAEPTSAPPVLEGPAVTGPAEFLRSRLWPILAEWVPGATEAMSRQLHAVLLACRWALIPHLGWARAYSEAIGPTAALHVVAVEPTWLTFADAWSAVGPVWRQAVSDPHRLYLVALQDVNRALPQCWGRAWLDLLAGFRDRLPDADASPWPTNLRVLAAPVLDDAGLDLVPAVVHHWAAVSRQPRGTLAAVPNTQPRNVRIDDWWRWATGDADAVTQTHDFQATDLGPLARAAVGDLRWLTAVLAPLLPDDEAAERAARSLRLDYPREYVHDATQPPQPPPGVAQPKANGSTVSPGPGVPGPGRLAPPRG